MGMLIKTKWMWMPGIAMLVSSSVTSQFIQSHPDLTVQIGQWHSHQALPADVYESCCTYRLPDNITTDIFQITLEKPDTASAPVAEIWTRMRDGFEFPEVDAAKVSSYIDEYVKHHI